MQASSDTRTMRVLYNLSGGIAALASRPRIPGAGEAQNYDTEGNTTTFEVYDADDGTLDSITTYTYDAAGNQISIAIDADADGVVDSIQSCTYDADSNQLGASIDSDADGVANTVTTNVYEPGSWWSLLHY